MSSDVTTQPTWNRLHVARRVSDIAKSMIRLSMLGRSIFPIVVLPGPGVEEPAVRLKVSAGWPARIRSPSAKAYPRSPAMAGEDEVRDRCRHRPPYVGPG